MDTSHVPLHVASRPARRISSLCIAVRILAPEFPSFFARIEMNPRNSNPTRRSRNPSCTLCANHGLRSELRGHKHVCPFNNCTCELCIRGRERREVMRKQVRLRRQQMKELYAKRCNKNSRGIYAVSSNNNPPKTTGISLAATNNSLSSSERRNPGYFEPDLVNSGAVAATTSTISHQSSQTQQNSSQYCEYSRFPHAVSLHPQNISESFTYYLNLSPPGITTPPECQSPRQCVSPLLGRLNVSENSAFVKLSPGQNRMLLEGGNGWPCEIKDGSSEAALALAFLPLQHKKI